MPEENETLTAEEKATLASYMNMNYPKPEEKTGIYHFFNKVLGLKDSSKVGNLDPEELNSVRSLKRAELYSEEMGLDLVKDYLQKRAETIVSTSLSKNMALIKAIITTKKESKTSLKTGEDKSKWKWGKKKEEE